MTRDRKISLRPLGAAAAPASVPAPAHVPPPAPAYAPATVLAVPAAGPDEAFTARVAEEVAEVLAGVLCTEPGDLDTERTFQTLGIDSILSVEFVALLNARYATDIKATDLYDHPTPTAFVRHVAAQLGAAAPQKPVSEQAVPAPAPAAVPPLAAPPAPAATLAGTGHDGHVATVLATLREQLAETLYCDIHDIDTDASFNSLGLDSILAAEFVAFVNNAYGLEEKAGVLYDHPSPTALAAHIASRTATPSAASAIPSAAPAAPADGVSTADLDALLAAVRDNRLTVEQALRILPQHT